MLPTQLTRRRGFFLCVVTVLFKISEVSVLPVVCRADSLLLQLISLPTCQPPLLPGQLAKCLVFGLDE